MQARADVGDLTQTVMVVVNWVQHVAFEKIVSVEQLA